jgi:short-subunit dehydrogenase
LVSQPSGKRPSGRSKAAAHPTAGAALFYFFESQAMGKTILITGAGTGIGHDAAFALAALGHHVLATTLNEAQAEALRKECAARAVLMEVMKLDITDGQDHALISNRQLDVLVNNAALGESGSLAEVDMARVRRIFEVNLFSTLALTQVALRGMIARQRGTVVFISSIAGRVPFPFVMPYGMTKFALSAAAAGLRAEMDQLDKGIGICVVEPGAIHTGFNQTMTASKYAWMGPDSYFYDQKEKIQAEEKRTFSFLEAKTTDAVVAAIVKASEAKRPRLRYVAPWIQGFGVRLARIFGV